MDVIENVYADCGLMVADSDPGRPFSEGKKFFSIVYNKITVAWTACVYNLFMNRLSEKQSTKC